MEARGFSLFHSMQSGSRAHPASCWMCNMGYCGSGAVKLPLTVI